MSEIMSELPTLKSPEIVDGQIAPWLLDKERARQKLEMVKAKRSLIDFIEMDGKPYWKRAAHLELLCKKLEGIEKFARGDKTGIPRLIVTMPPRHGKSYVISRKFPAWFLARNPDIEVILATYGAELAQDHSEVARETFKEWAPPLWNLTLSDSTQAKAKWRISNHLGGMTAVGIGGATTGRGAGLFIIDDPVENAGDGLSPKMQEKAWNWWQTVAYTRLSPNASVVILMTRWAQQDLVGKILDYDEKSDMPQNWEILNLPAICESDNDPIGRKVGDVLWPERFSRDWILAKKASTESFWWQSLWQQKPLDITNQVFKPEDMQFVDPKTVDLHACKLYGACDPSEGGNDYAAIVIMALTPDFRWLVWEANLSVDSQSQTIEKLVKYNRQYNFTRFLIEQNSLGHARSAPGKSVFEIELNNQLRQSGKAMPYLFEWNTSNKIDRVRSLEPYYIQGKLAFREDYNVIYKDLIEQLRMFPFYEHDDGPDALEMCVRTIIQDASTSMLPKVPKKLIRVGGGWSSP